MEIKILWKIEKNISMISPINIDCFNYYREILIILLRNIKYDTFIYYSDIIKPFYSSRLQTVTQFFSSRDII